VEPKLLAKEAPKGVFTLWVKELRFTWLWIFFLSILPAFLYGSGILSVVVLATAVLIGIPSALFGIVTKHSKNRGFRRLAIMLVVPVLTMVFVSQMDRKIPENATPLIQAIETFQRDTGHYPASLEALIPNYLENLPVVRFSVVEPSITYRITDGKPNLTIPSAMGDMFAQFEYDFEAKVWMHHS
jgi:hypothetical protein